MVKYDQVFLKTLSRANNNNIDKILYDHDGIQMKEILLVSRIIYPLLNKDNHMKVEAHMAPPLPLTSLSSDPQKKIYKI
jgi:hypothetical protein